MVSVIVSVRSFQRHSITDSDDSRVCTCLAQSDQPGPLVRGRPCGNTVSPPSSGVVLGRSKCRI